MQFLYSIFSKFLNTSFLINKYETLFDGKKLTLVEIASNKSSCVQIT